MFVTAKARFLPGNVVFTYSVRLLPPARLESDGFAGSIQSVLSLPPSERLEYS
jgi:hypothetical protein